MLDANGRPIEVGDTVATPYEKDDLLGLSKHINDAILGKVIDTFTETEVYVHLGDGITRKAAEVVTLGGLEWVTCQECGFSWPFDARMNEEEECPDCGALLHWEPTAPKS